MSNWLRNIWMELRGKSFPMRDLPRCEFCNRELLWWDDPLRIVTVFANGIDRVVGLVVPPGPSGRPMNICEYHELPTRVTHDCYTGELLNWQPKLTKYEQRCNECKRYWLFFWYAVPKVFIRAVQSLTMTVASRLGIAHKTPKSWWVAWWV
jgi:hypothetical protein